MRKSSSRQKREIRKSRNNSKKSRKKGDFGRKSEIPYTEKPTLSLRKWAKNKQKLRINLIFP